MKRDEILMTLEAVREEVRQRYKAEIRGIFGSFARGDDREQSDIDVLVEFQEGADLFDFVGVSLFLEEKLLCNVDIVPQSSLREEIKPYVLEETIYL